MAETWGALAGLRVLDLSRVLAGPFCCAMLGDHGADVIKVEPPAGDETRHYGPPFVPESVYYLNINRNKRGMVLDLSTSEGQEIVRRLVQTSDVLVENFKTGTMERWGLGYEALRALNPRLIYAAISGFGRRGPYAGVAGYGGALQAFGGFMSVNGQAGGEPTKAGIAIADLSTGMFANQAILLALHRRHVTGVGQMVEASLMHSIVGLLHPHNGNYLNAGLVGKPHGNSHPMIAPYDLFSTADRPIYIPSGNDPQFGRLARVVGRPDLGNDPRFRTNQDRVAHRPEMIEALSEQFTQRPANEWCRLLWDANVPAGPVNSIDEVFADPQVVDRRLVREISHPSLPAGVFRSVAPPATLRDTPGDVRRHPPGPGEHTVEVLAELGYSRSEVEQLVVKGVARRPEPASDAEASVAQSGPRLADP